MDMQTPVDYAVRNLSEPAPPPVIEYTDFFSFGEIREFTLPDGRQTIQFKVMNEGDRVAYQSKTNRDIRFNQDTRDAHLKNDQAGDRWALIDSCVIGWTLMRRDASGGWVPAPFSSGSKGSELNKWLQVADPKIVDDLEFAIRLANPWIQGDMSLEDIQKERARLDELEASVREREQEKASSSSR